jgi:hypothetical protein
VIETAEEFVRLRSSSDPGDYLRAATEEAAEAVWLDIVQTYPEMRFWVAQNKSVPLSILAVLSTDKDARVRLMVAMKNKLSPELFEVLAGDSEPGIRSQLARNKNCPRSILKTLSIDPMPEVAAVATDRLRQRS